MMMSLTELILTRCDFVSVSFAPLQKEALAESIVEAALQRRQRSIILNLPFSEEHTVGSDFPQVNISQLQCQVIDDVVAPCGCNTAAVQRQLSQLYSAETQHH